VSGGVDDRDVVVAAHGPQFLHHPRDRADQVFVPLQRPFGGDRAAPPVLVECSSPRFQRQRLRLAGRLRAAGGATGVAHKGVGSGAPVGPVEAQQLPCKRAGRSGEEARRLRRRHAVRRGQRRRESRYGGRGNCLPASEPFRQSVRAAVAFESRQKTAEAGGLSGQEERANPRLRPRGTEQQPGATRRERLPVDLAQLVPLVVVRDDDPQVRRLFRPRPHACFFQRRLQRRTVQIPRDKHGDGTPPKRLHRGARFDARFVPESGQGGGYFRSCLRDAPPLLQDVQDVVDSRGVNAAVERVRDIIGAAASVDQRDDKFVGGAVKGFRPPLGERERSFAGNRLQAAVRRDRRGLHRAPSEQYGMNNLPYRMGAAPEVSVTTL